MVSDAVLDAACVRKVGETKSGGYDVACCWSVRGKKPTLNILLVHDYLGKGIYRIAQSASKYTNL